MSLIIDGFAHVFPKSFGEELLNRYPTPQLEELVNYTQFSDMENRVRVLDKHKIDKQVLTLARPDIWINIPKDVLLDMTRCGNDAVAAAAALYPDRFIPVATLPEPTEDFLPEFDRCINELGMAGIQVFSNIGGKYLEAPEFRSFLEKANATKTPIWIHPQLREEWSHEFVLDKMLGWPYDTTVAMCRLVFSGVMEELPDLKIITHHMGGMVPFYSERIKGFYDSRSMYPSAGVKELSQNPLNYFKRFFNDTVLNGALHSFECGYKFFGAAQTVFATDYPFGPGQGETWMAGTLDQMSRIEIAAKEKEMIYSGNLLNLIKRS